ncbi:hypothetical protein OG570_08335 [Amycolatopsis sp. NBC_01286]|nr:hypothetical protein OG570_08335 [Amycolatopsis sp. NBC_01286]
MNSSAIGRGWTGVRGTNSPQRIRTASAGGATPKNNARHEPVCSSAPPPPTRMARLAGITAAAPTPLSTRPASTGATSFAHPDNSAPAVKTPSPASGIPLRPKRSAAAPAGISRQAKTTT